VRRRGHAARTKDTYLAAQSTVSGDEAEGVARLKQGEGPELQVYGSGNLSQTLIRYGLIDEMQICTL
jgi:dihydrofolate reductase